MFAKSAIVASLVAAAAAVSPAGALAGKPGGGGTGGSTSSTISLVRPAGTDSTYPRYGDSVTFQVSTPVAQPYVNLQCFQNGALVASGWAGYFDGALGSRSFTLDSPQWTGGAADCTAYLDQYTRKGTWQPVASTSFHVTA